LTRKEKIGFALLLFGSLFAVPDPIFWWAGVALGLAGLILVILGDKPK